MREQDSLVNICTGAVFNNDIETHVRNLNKIGDESYQEFKEKRIHGNEVNLWEPIKSSICVEKETKRWAQKRIILLVNLKQIIHFSRDY